MKPPQCSPRRGAASWPKLLLLLAIRLFQVRNSECWATRTCPITSVFDSERRGSSYWNKITTRHEFCDPETPRSLSALFEKPPLMGGYLAELIAANIYVVAVLIEKSLKPCSGNRRQIFGCQANRTEINKPDSNTQGKFLFLFPLKCRLLNWRFYLGNLGLGCRSSWLLAFLWELSLRPLKLSSFLFILIVVVWW